MSDGTALARDWRRKSLRYVSTSALTMGIDHVPVIRAPFLVYPLRSMNQQVAAVL